ncbi:MAG TPA: sigma-70 family RNA polymerase sigma factor [Pirellulales bacterium]|jgi:RNA polymerase sigma-70 factor (ECF subfamily)|nr:sigma-70 family RNA polymerase sigma factor [Pirellulales bacterium]
MNALTEELTNEKATLVARVRAAQQGDRAAFGELVEQFERAVFGTALKRLRDRGEAQELTQEVFVQALRKIGQLREPECFGGWLRAITNRLAINRQVRRGPVFSAECETLEAVSPDESPLGQVLAAERRRQVRAGLRRLRSLDRQTLVAFYVKGRSLVEMSTEFRSPVGTIKRRLHVARKRLARELEELAPA